MAGEAIVQGRTYVMNMDARMSRTDGEVRW
jgi:hypothetical protein